MYPEGRGKPLKDVKKNVVTYSDLCFRKIFLDSIKGMEKIESYKGTVYLMKREGKS